MTLVMEQHVFIGRWSLGLSPRENRLASIQTKRVSKQQLIKEIFYERLQTH